MSSQIENAIKKNVGDFFPNALIYPTIFSVLFPKYKEKYIRESWDLINRILKSFFIQSRLDVSTGSIKISTTEFTKDPYAIINARDFLNLISRSVPVDQASKIFDDTVFCDIIKISSFTRNKDIFLKKRKRLIGYRGSTVRAIELTTKTYILIQGNTVSCMGTHIGIKQVRKIIQNCMKDIHPIYYIRIFIIKQGLFKDPELKDQSWDRFFPLFYKENQHKKLLNKSKEVKFQKKKSKKSTICNELTIRETYLDVTKNPNCTYRFERFFQKTAKMLKIKPCIY